MEPFSTKKCNSIVNDVWYKTGWFFLRSPLGTKKGGCILFDPKKTNCVQNFLSLSFEIFVSFTNRTKANFKKCSAKWNLCSPHSCSNICIWFCTWCVKDIQLLFVITTQRFIFCKYMCQRHRQNLSLSHAASSFVSAKGLRVLYGRLYIVLQENGAIKQYF